MRGPVHAGEGVTGVFKQGTPRRTITIISIALGLIIVHIIIFLMLQQFVFARDSMSFEELVALFWHLLPFGIAGAVSWGIWGVRFALARSYKPLVNDYRTTTSVVVPSYREDPEVTVRCLETWLRGDPDEIIIVVDVDDTDVINRLADYEHDPRLRVIPFKHHGKRSALGVGIREARYDILVLTDSDTSWEDGLLDAVQMPFVDPKVGGVSTRQSAFLRESSVWRIVADWLVNIRYLDYVPVEGMLGGVACLSGRTAAYRREAVLPVTEHLEREYFMGIECVAGDDGRLTWLVLGQGYKTVYQSNARAWSMFPNQLQAFIKQRIRWSRNSYRCYLTSIWTGWLWHQPIMTQLRVLQILFTPVTMFFTLLYLVLLIVQAHWFLVGAGLAWLFVGRGLRSLSHLREHPRDIWLLPVVTLAIIVIALPIKIWAFVSMNKHGWLTRTADSVGGEGQSEASLYTFPDAIEGASLAYQGAASNDAGALLERDEAVAKGETTHGQESQPRTA